MNYRQVNAAILDAGQWALGLCRDHLTHFSKKDLKGTSAGVIVRRDAPFLEDQCALFSV